MLPKINSHLDDNDKIVEKCKLGIKIVEELVKQNRDKVPEAVLQSMINWKLKYEACIELTEEYVNVGPFLYTREIFTGPFVEQDDEDFIDFEYEHPLRGVQLWREPKVYQQPATPPVNWLVLQRITPDWIMIPYYEYFYPNGYVDREYYIDDDFVYVREITNHDGFAHFLRKFENFYRIFEFPKINLHDEFEIQLYIAQDSLKRIKATQEQLRSTRFYDCRKYEKRFAQWEKIIKILTQTKKPFTTLSEVPEDLRDRIEDPFGHDPKIWLLNEWENIYEIMRDEKGKIWYKIRLIRGRYRRDEEQKGLVDNNVRHLEKRMNEANEYERKDVYDVLKRKWVIWERAQRFFKYQPNMLIISPREELPGCFEPYPIEYMDYREIRRLNVKDDDKTQWIKAGKTIEYLEQTIREANRYLEKYKKAREYIDNTNQPMRVIPWDIQEIFEEYHDCDYIFGKPR